MSRIISIGTAVPKYSTNQSEILTFMHAAYEDEIASRKLNLLFNHSGISTRYSAIPDFDLVKSQHVLFNGSGTIPKVEERLNVFKESAVLLAISAIQNAFENLNMSIAEARITHLITVTCTGLYAPGLDTELIEQLNLPKDIFHTAINFLGCNAAFHALKVGDMIVKTDKNAKVLILCVELCTLHFQPKNNHDNLLSNTIFGDGAAALIMESDGNHAQNKYEGLTLNGFYSHLLSEEKNLMGWNVTPINFEMILDAKVPEFIGGEIINIVGNAARKFNINTGTIDNWAIHPGGKKILDTIKRELQLSDADLLYSYRILDMYGNMSSPTILFVLNEIIRNKPNSGETILSIGFGPGLSIETALCTYEE